MSNLTVPDLSLLPPPDAVEALDYEELLAANLASLRSYDAAFDAMVESDPAYKLVQLFTYREALLIQRMNDKVRAVMLASAAGSDLDHLGAFYGVSRLVLTPADPGQSVPATLEGDADFRRRIQLAPKGYSVAGPTGAYVYHGLSADPDVLDISAVSPVAGNVTVYVLSRVGNGAASADLIAKVYVALNSEAIRPLTDNVSVLSASIVDYAINASLIVKPGPDSATIVTTARLAAQAYADSAARLGAGVSLSAIYRALHQEGVERVALSSPAGDIDIGEGEASYCISINLVATVDE